MTGEHDRSDKYANLKKENRLRFIIVVT